MHFARIEPRVSTNLAGGRVHKLHHGNFSRRKRIRNASFYDVRVARLNCMNVWIRMNPAWLESDTHKRTPVTLYEVRYGTRGYSKAPIGGRR